MGLRFIGSVFGSNECSIYAFYLREIRIYPELVNHTIKSNQSLK